MKVRIWKAKVGHVKPEISLVISIIAGAEIGGTAWITSLLRPGDDDSLHQSGRAVDLDTTGTETNKELLRYLRRSLSDEYDVIMEDIDEANEHIHVEYDPS
jgi:hypothetical protein